VVASPSQMFSVPFEVFGPYLGLGLRTGVTCWCSCLESSFVQNFAVIEPEIERNAKSILVLPPRRLNSFYDPLGPFLTLAGEVG